MISNSSSFNEHFITGEKGIFELEEKEEEVVGSITLTHKSTFFSVIHYKKYR